MVGGAAYEITLDARSEEEALIELARFRADPVAYVSPAKARAAVVTIDRERVRGFLAHLKDGERSANYIKEATTMLASWGGALAGRDLATLDSKTLLRALSSWTTCRKMRIIYFKSFCSWLVSTGDLDPRDSPGRFLTVPSSRRTHGVKGYTIAAVEKFYAALPTQFLRDAVCLLAKTGMHLSEAQRMASGGGALTEVADCAPIAGTVAFRHKTGAEHVISLDVQAFCAARRLAAVGRAPACHSLHDASAVATRDFGCDKINPGALRHSFATWAVERGTKFAPKGKGLSVDEVAERLGHTNTRTTKTHYLSVSVPPMIIIPITLWHPEDPTDLRAAPGSTYGSPRRRYPGER